VAGDDGAGPAATRPAPSRGLGVGALLAHQATRLGPRPFLALPDGQLSFAGADELANRAANVLADLGYGVGDIVMCRAGNGLAAVATWFACMKLGAVFMPVNSLLSGEPLRRVMAHSRGRVLVCEAELYPRLAAVRAGLADLTHVLVAGGPAPEGTLSLDHLLERAAATPPPALADDPAAPAKLMYTSGTTGVPKGVLWSRWCEATWARCYGEEMVPIAPGESTYCCLPLSHVTCQGTALAALWCGGRITIDAGFSPYAFWDRVRQAEAVAFTFVGTILSVLARRPEQADDADNPVRRILGAAAPADCWREVERRFGLVIVEVWGQTETASCWTMPVALPQAPGTVGRPTPRFEARIVGDDGEGRPPGTPGEMWIRPLQPHVMFEGYLADGGGLSRPWSAEGWYRTGDTMLQREDGDFEFVGRLRDAIRRRGEMISASDVEQAALAHPGVVEAAAVGVPAGDGFDEEVKLCAVPRPGADLDPAELHRFVLGRLPRFMVPRFVDVRAELPKTPTTRVQKYRLRDEGTAGVWDSRRKSAPAPGPD